MSQAPSVEDPSIFVEVLVSADISRAAEMAANAASQSANELLQDILLSYLFENGMLRGPIDLERVLSVKKLDQ